jgi:predicted MFS family arabinose efflux permease
VTGEPALVRDSRTWLVYAQLGTWGWFLYGFGPALTLLRDERGFSRTVAGLHGTALATGTLVAALVVAPLAIRFGRARMVWVGLALMCLGILVLCSLPMLPATLAGAMLCSLGGSFVVTCTATALSAAHGESGPAAITEANAVAAGVGAVAPLAVGIAAALGSWRVALLLLLPVVAVLAVLARSTPPLPDRAPPLPAGRQGRLPGRYWVSWLVVTGGVGVEFCLSLWAADLLHQRTELSRAAAAASVTALVAGMFAGRVAGGRLALRYPVDRLLFGALALNAVGFALFWGSTVGALAVAGLLACGLGVSVYWPLGLSRAIAASGGRPDQASARVGIGVAVASGGGPFVLGALADAAGIHVAMLVVPALLVVAAAAVRLSPMRGAQPDQLVA